MERDIIQQRVWNTKQVVSIVGSAIVITFAATMIWARFLYVETAVTTVDERYRKITDRIILRVEKLEKTYQNERN